jgi:hypothetical protein
METAVGYLKVLSQNLSGRIEENDENDQSGYLNSKTPEYGAGMIQLFFI